MVSTAPFPHIELAPGGFGQRGPPQQPGDHQNKSGEWEEEGVTRWHTCGFASACGDFIVWYMGKVCNMCI